MSTDAEINAILFQATAQLTKLSSSIYTKTGPLPPPSTQTANIFADKISAFTGTNNADVLSNEHIFVRVGEILSNIEKINRRGDVGDVHCINEGNEDEDDGEKNECPSLSKQHVSALNYISYCQKCYMLLQSITSSTTSPSSPTKQFKVQLLQSPITVSEINVLLQTAEDALIELKTNTTTSSSSNLYNQASLILEAIKKHLTRKTTNLVALVGGIVSCRYKFDCDHDDTEGCISYDDSSSNSESNSSSSSENQSDVSISVYDCFQVLFHLGLNEENDYYLEDFISKRIMNGLNDGVLKCILSGSCNVACEDGKVLKFVTDSYSHSHSKSDSDVICNKITNLKTLFAFLYTTMITSANSSETSKICEILGRIIFQPSLQTSITTMLNDSIPSNPSTIIETLAKIKPIVIDFETSMIKMGLLKESDDSSSRIVNNYEVLFGKKRGEFYLKRAGVICSDDEGWINSVEVGVDVGVGIGTVEIERSEMFDFELCKVTVNTVNVLILVKECLEECLTLHASPSDLSAATIPVLYQTTRQILTLYRCLSHNATESPRSILLNHNSNHYLAHACLTLHVKYSEAGGKHRSFSYVDLIPVFRGEGTKAINAYISTCNPNIVKILKSGLSNLTPLMLRSSSSNYTREWEAFNDSILTSHSELSKIQTLTSTLLPYTLKNRMLCHIIDSMLSLVIGGIVSVKEISADSSRLIAESFNLAVSGVVGKIVGEVNKMNTSRSRSDSSSSSNIMNLQKFLVITSFMDFSLTKIAEELTKGYFRCLSSVEMRGLVKATFDESLKREKVLMALGE